MILVRLMLVGCALLLVGVGWLAHFPADALSASCSSQGMTCMAIIGAVPVMAYTMAVLAVLLACLPAPFQPAPSSHKKED